MDIVNFVNIVTESKDDDPPDLSSGIMSRIQERLPLINLLKTVCTSQISLIRLQNRELLIDLFSKNLRKIISRERVEEIFSQTKVTDSDKIIYSMFRNEVCRKRTTSSSFSSSYERSPISDKRQTQWIPRKGRESRESSRQQDIFRFYDGKPTKYLDLGGGDGKISSSIGNYLRLKRDEIICADIETWWDSDIRTELEPITYAILEENSGLPFRDEEFSLVTCFQSLHHMRDIDRVIFELYRITSHGGYVIIREHDCDSNFMKMLIDVEHCIFEKVLKVGTLPESSTEESGSESDPFAASYYGDYRSKLEWSNLFIRHGFVFCHRRYNFKTSRNNPTRYFYSMYYKE